MRREQVTLSIRCDIAIMSDTTVTPDTLNLHDITIHSLPNEILTLLPPCLDWHSIVSVARVCRRWSILFALPPTLKVHVEFWDDEEREDNEHELSAPMAVTVLLGYGHTLYPRLTQPVIDLYEDWEGRYCSWVLDLPLTEISLVVEGRVKWICYPIAGKLRMKREIDSVPFYCITEIVTESDRYALFRLSSRDKNSWMYDGTGTEVQVGSWHPWLQNIVPTSEERDAFFMDLLVLRVSRELDNELANQHAYLALSSQWEWCAFYYPKNDFYDSCGFDGYDTHEAYTVDARAGVPCIHVILRDNKSISWDDEVYGWGEGISDSFNALKRLIEVVRRSF